MSPELLIIDLDGTLVDSFDEIRRGMEVALTAIDVEPTSALLALSRRGVSLEVYYRTAIGRDAETATERARFARFVDAYLDHYRRYHHTARCYDDVAETLIEIRARRPELRLAVGTNKRTDLARESLERAGLDAHFDLVQGTENIAKKPAPALLHLIAEALGVHIERTLMLGDTGADVQAAQRAGCRAMAVTYGGWPREELAALGPERLLDRFADLLDVLA